MGFPGSIETEEAKRKGWLIVSSVTDRSKVANLMHKYGISLGNAETIQLAVECEAELALADELEVRLLLEKYGVKVRGCIGILIESAKEGVISVEEAKNGIKRLVETGYRVSDNVLKRAYELLGEGR